MNREIKFRAWDKITNKMCYLNDPHWSLSLQFGKDGLGVYNLQNGSGGDEYELMQYTGLKDKNGKEIYEGDIVCGYPSSHPHKEMAYLFDDVVEWDEWRWSPFYSKDEEYGWYAPRCEVIGNIYENPDLLPVSPDK
jgi:uncharacterized phage protein (TIGR01671 family)